MSDFKCFRGFTTRTGKEYAHGDLISEAEYDALHYMDKVRFIRVSGTARYRPPDRDDNETFPVVLPIYGVIDDNDTIRDTRNQTNQDDTPQFEFSGGSFGGAGAGSNNDTRDNDRDDTDSHSDNDNDTSDDCGGSSNDD